MLAACECAEHSSSILRVGWLTQNFITDFVADFVANDMADDDGIGTKNLICGMALKYRAGFSLRESLDAGFGRFSQNEIFRNVRGLHDELDTGIAEQFLTTRRSRGKDKH